MKPVEGKYYTTSDGQVLGPMKHEPYDEALPWTDGNFRWRANGTYISADSPHPLDLIAVADLPPPAVIPYQPAPSDFVRQTAAQIMAADYWKIARDDDDMAKAAVAAAIALERALQEAGK